MLPLATPVVWPLHRPAASTLTICAGTGAVVEVGGADEVGGGAGVDAVGAGGGEAAVLRDGGAGAADVTSAVVVGAELLTLAEVLADDDWRLMPTGSPDPPVDPLQPATAMTAASPAAITRRFILTSTQQPGHSAPWPTGDSLAQPVR